MNKPNADALIPLRNYIMRNNLASAGAGGPVLQVQEHAGHAFFIAHGSLFREFGLGMSEVFSNMEPSRSPALGARYQDGEHLLDATGKLTALRK